MASLEEDMEIEESRRTTKYIPKTAYHQDGAHGPICNGPISGDVKATHEIGLVNSSSGSHNQSRITTAQGDVNMAAVHVHFNTPTLATRLKDVEVEVRSGFVQRVIESGRAFFRGLADRDTLHDPTAGEATPESSVASVPAYYSININLSPEADPELEDGKGGGGIDDKTGSSYNSEMKFDEGCTMSSMGDLDSLSMKSQAMSYGVVYTRCMLNCRTEGLGLPCWRPTPYPPTGQQGVVPGDVGIFDLVRGFRKIFNLREHGCTGLPAETVTVSDYFAEGDIIPNGVSSRTHRSEDGRSIVELNFSCNAEEGALLACTRSADLEEIANTVPLEEFLIENAGAVYRYASSIHPLGRDESLYIITGCIKSDGWSLAAFRDARPGDLLRLSKRYLRNHSMDEGKIYEWKERGPAEAKLWPNTAKEATSYCKNQSLFLQGFKLALSAPFRARMDSMKSTIPEGDPFEPDQRHDETNAAAGSSSDDSGSTGATGSGSNLSNSSSTNSGMTSFPSDIQAHSFSSAPTIFHPCDMINKQLLEMTGGDCALSHDKNWMFQDALWRRDDMEALSWDIILSETLSVHKGVAHLARRPDGATRLSSNVTNAAPGSSSEVVDTTLELSSKVVRTTTTIPVSPAATTAASTDSDSSGAASRNSVGALRMSVSRLFGTDVILAWNLQEVPEPMGGSRFTAIVELRRQVHQPMILGMGSGFTPREAERAAAVQALQYLQTQPNCGLSLDGGYGGLPGVVSRMAGRSHLV